MRRLKNICKGKTKYVSYILVILVCVLYYDAYTSLLYKKNIECHTSTIEDDFPQLRDDNIYSTEKTIFFTVTSCTGTLSERQACSIESAAIANPNWQINVLFLGPTTLASRISSPLNHLLALPNVYFYRIYKGVFAKNTPLADVISDKRIKLSPYGIYHISDLTRYILLYKYGGVYLDTDMIVMRSFDSLPLNFVTKESAYEISAGIIAFSRDEMGRKLAAIATETLQKHFEPYRWINAVGTVQGVLETICEKGDARTYCASKCQGVPVYDSLYFYPYHYTSAQLYFRADSGTMASSNESYAHHMWNKITSGYKVEKGCWYAQLAAKYCPVTYNTHIEKFAGK